MKKSGRPKEKIYPVLSLPPYFKGSLFSHLKIHDKVEVAGLGTFSLVKIAPRKMYHNFSDKERVLKGYVKLKFTQSPLLKKKLTQKS